MDHQKPPWSYKVEPLLANFDTATKPSLEVHSTLELKPLPSNLKYAFLGPNNALLVIVTSDLSGSQKEALLKVLSKYKEAVGWIIAYLKGISPSLCMHLIVTDPDIKPSKSCAKALNPNMKEIAEEWKLLKWARCSLKKGFETWYLTFPEDDKKTSASSSFSKRNILCRKMVEVVAADDDWKDQLLLNTGSQALS
ncbi:hypothetical protein Tco_0886489 [Tanacetum coccineum]